MVRLRVNGEDYGVMSERAAQMYQEVHQKNYPYESYCIENVPDDAPVFLAIEPDPKRIIVARRGARRLDRDRPAARDVQLKGADMPPTVKLILLVLAFVLFLLAAFSVAVPRINFVAMGLAVWVLTQLVP